MFVFQISGDQRGFSGSLTVGNKTIHQDEPRTIKKGVRKALAEMGVEVVKGMQEKEMEKKSVAGPQPNWVGLLQSTLEDLVELSFHMRNRQGLATFRFILMSAHRIPRPPRRITSIYTEHAMGRGFSCTCSIPLYPELSFGAGPECFDTRKAARTHAAAEAMKFLIKEGVTNLDGSMKPKQKAAKKEW